MKQSVPALHDLTSTIGEIIPIPILKLWAESEKTGEAHDRILEPYKIQGTLICSDSVGLSKMSGEYNLFRILRLIEEPKEVLNSIFNEIHGVPIGVWCADNSTTFIGAEVPVDKVIESALKALSVIETLTVKIGLCIHAGNFYKFGDNLFGDDLDFCNLLAENYTSAQEVVATGETLKNTRFEKYKNLRSDLNFSQPVFKVDSINLPSATVLNNDINYNRPFDNEFVRLLKEQNIPALEKRLTRDSYICLIHLNDRDRQLLLLDKYLQRIQNIAALQGIEDRHSIRKIKCDGQLAIYTGREYNDVFAFAIELSKLAFELNCDLKVAITFGDFLVFKLPDSRNEIAGSPINIASKLAEDTPDGNAIYIHDSVREIETATVQSAQAFSYTISSVVLNGVRIPLD